MNVVPFLCRMVLNLHQKQPSSVTSGCLFHRTIQHKIAVPSSVLIAMVQGNYPCHPSFRHTIRRKTAAPSFVLMAMVQGNYPRHPPFHRTIRREIAAPSSVLMGDGARKLPPSSVILPHNTTRNRNTITHFDGRWCSKVTPAIRHSTAQYDTKSQRHHPF